MKLPKYNLAYNTRDQLQSLAINAGERKYVHVLRFHSPKSFSVLPEPVLFTKSPTGEMNRGRITEESYTLPWVAMTPTNDRYNGVSMRLWGIFVDCRCCGNNNTGGAVFYDRQIASKDDVGRSIVHVLNVDGESFHYTKPWKQDKLVQLLREFIKDWKQ